MKNYQINFRIILRRPKFPVIVFAADDILPSFNVRELGTACYFSEPFENDGKVKVIDSAGEEFIYMVEQIALFSWFFEKKVNKRKIIDLFNDGKSAKEKNLQYSLKAKLLFQAVNTQKNTV